MKILFFIESLRSGGKERRLVELIKGLAANPSLEMEIVLTKKDIHYKDIFSTNIKVHYTVRKFLKKDPQIFFKFYSIAKKFRPDVIHVWGNLVAIYALPAKVILRIPLVNNQITDAPLNVSNSILSHKLTFPYSDKIIANCYAGLKAYDAPENKSSVIYNGFDFDRISNLYNKDIIREKFSITTKYIIGMVASFSEKKDFETYVRSANLVLSKGFDVTFLCIGAGDDSKCKQIVDQNNVNRILFLGKQSNVESIMNICDIGVLITNNEKHGEGISNALLEFSALNKPLIATLGGGNGELIQEGHSGFLIGQKAPDELAEKIAFFLEDDKRRVDFGNKGRERIENEFTIEKMINAFTNAYSAIIKEKK